MSAFDEFCLFRIAEALKNMKVNEALAILEIKFGSRRKFILVLLKPCSWKKGLEKNQLNKLTISHLLPQHLNITVAVMLSLAETIKHLKNRQNSMLFHVKSMRFKSQQVHTSKSSTIEDGPQECHDKEGSRERFGVFPPPGFAHMRNELGLHWSIMVWSITKWKDFCRMHQARISKVTKSIPDCLNWSSSCDWQTFHWLWVVLLYPPNIYIIFPTEIGPSPMRGL